MSAIKKLPSIDKLHELLLFDLEAGTMTWKPRACVKWNGRWAGKPAFNTVNSRGYLVGKIDSVSYLAHRILFKVYTGCEPPDHIDHKNQNKQDNRKENLREATHETNMRNRKISKNNTSGANGLRKSSSGRWLARIAVNGRERSLGSYPTKEAAVAARQAAETKYGYHPNHGKRLAFTN